MAIIGFETNQNALWRATTFPGTRVSLPATQNQAASHSETEFNVNTQWPRFEVFQQDGPNQPHRHAATSQAPNDETALRSARNEFAQRPAWTSLWVAPQNQVYGWTTAALQADPSWQTDTIVLARHAAPYEVFVKHGQDPAAAKMVHVGAVDARSPTEALRLALAQFATDPVAAWWLVPARAILRAER